MNWTDAGLRNLGTVAARGRIPKPAMNKTEAAYADNLEIRRRVGEIAYWAFEAITLKLADDTRYTPDFLVMMPDGLIQLHETKGFFRDDAKVKIRVAARLFPFEFYVVRLAAGDWNVEAVKP